MGSLNRLISLLQTNFSDEEIERLKMLLETRTKFHGSYEI